MVLPGAYILLLAVGLERMAVRQSALRSPLAGSMVVRMRREQDLTTRNSTSPIPYPLPSRLRPAALPSITRLGRKRHLNGPTDTLGQVIQGRLADQQQRKAIGKRDLVIILAVAEASVVRARDSGTCTSRVRFADDC